MGITIFNSELLVDKLTADRLRIVSGATDGFILVSDSNGDITQANPINVLANIGTTNLTLTNNRALNFDDRTLTFNNVKNFRVLDSGNRVSGDTTLYIQSSKNTANNTLLEINNLDGNILKVDSDGSLNILGNTFLSGDNTFGVDLSNQHVFSGSVNINGSILLNNETILSTSDALIEVNLSGSTDGVNDIFILNPEPLQGYPFLFFIGGVLQNNNQYMISGNTLQTVSPPPSGSTLQSFGLIIPGKDRYKNLSITVDNGNNEITSGVKGIINVPFNGQILGWSIITNSIGSAVIDIYRDSFDDFTYPGSSLNSITGVNKPTINSQIKVKSNNLNTWITNINKYDVLTINIDSVVDINYLNFNLYLKDIN
jgi:hypothetical protein